MLLYAETDTVIQPDNVYQIQNNQINVRNLYLNLPFEHIAGQMDAIVGAHFLDIKKKQ